MNRGEGRFPAWLVLLGAVTALGPLSIDMYLPSFPAIAQGMGVERGAIERTLAVFLVGLALGQLTYGPLSDRYGRRPPLLVGLCIYVLGSGACALSDTAGEFTLWRLVQAMGGAAGVVMSRAVIRDRLDLQASAQAISTIMLVMGLAPILAPLIGGWVLGLGGWRGIFVFQAIVGLLCLAWAWLRMVETLPEDAGRVLRFGDVLHTYARLLRDRRLMLPSLSGGFAMAGMFAYIAGSPFVLITLYGVSPQHYGLVFGLNALGLVFMSQVNARWLRTRTPLAILRRTGVIPAAAGCSLLVLAVSAVLPLPVLMAALFAYVASLGAITPNASAIAMAEQGRAAGAASALLGTCIYFCGMLAGFTMSLFSGASVLPLAGVMAACGLISWSLGRRIDGPGGAPAVSTSASAAAAAGDIDPMA